MKMLPPLDACRKLKIQWPDSNALLLSVLQRCALVFCCHKA